MLPNGHNVDFSGIVNLFDSVELPKRCERIREILTSIFDLTISKGNYRDAANFQHHLYISVKFLSVEYIREKAEYYFSSLLEEMFNTFCTPDYMTYFAATYLFPYAMESGIYARTKSMLVKNLKNYTTFFQEFIEKI